MTVLRGHPLATNDAALALEVSLGPMVRVVSIL